MQTRKSIFVYNAVIRYSIKFLYNINPVVSVSINNMLSEKEDAFIQYWEEHRKKKGSVFSQLFPGLPIGLCLGAAIMLALDLDWYKRANIEAKMQSSPVVIFIGITAIVVFTNFFYKRFKWEMNEQAYKELKMKQKLNTNEQSNTVD